MSWSARSVVAAITGHKRKKIHACNLTKALAVVFLTACGVAHAQERDQIEVTATAEIREEVESTTGSRHWRFAPAQDLRQGDEIHFTLRIRNISNVVAPDVNVVWRIPANTIYVPGSARAPAAAVSFSVDGGRTFDKSRSLRVVDTSGTQRIAVAADYTHIHWRLRYPLASGAVALARFRAVFK